MAPRKKPTAVMYASKVAERAVSSSASTLPVALPPGRLHTSAYHFPLLCNDDSTCGKLLSWFEDVEETRNMPWRKAWINPETFEGKEEELQVSLAKRAYEIWVSEIMLQQTRVSTVIPYFNNWISKWPTVQDLAEATHDEVLAAWKGLGYYSRATRLHEGAKAMIAKSPGSSLPIPSLASDLQHFPGIGRYTAGAISSIAFGEAEPVLDGNVARVLSRQLGLYVNVKDKKSTDLLWEVADQLIKHVSKFPGAGKSSIPGQWNQAMMELGSTICTPRPRCDECPIQATCRALQEGQALSKRKEETTAVPDIEDACSRCESLDTEDLVVEINQMDLEEQQPRPSKKIKTSTQQSNTISRYFTSNAAKTNEESVEDEGKDASRKRKPPASSTLSHTALAYCSLFPKRVAKKQVAQEECVVCLIELCQPDGSSKWLIEQRPAKGLLASLWQFPQSTLTESQNTPARRKASAQEHVSSLEVSGVDMSETDYVHAFPALVHVFTHLKLTMHPFQYKVIADDTEAKIQQRDGGPARKWVDPKSMDSETLSTGMRKCWELIVKDD